MTTTYPISGPIASEKRLRELWHDHTVEQIAEILRVTERTVNRAAVRYGIREKIVTPGPPERVKQRVRNLHWEGVPANWIAEDVDLSVGQVRDILGRGARTAPEWKSVWHEIYKRPELLALHREFCPAAAVSRNWHREAA